jgi:hypothetical protein
MRIFHSEARHAPPPMTDEAEGSTTSVHAVETASTSRDHFLVEGASSESPSLFHCRHLMDNAAMASYMAHTWSQVWHD